MISENARKAIIWLDDKGWSELIDERWTLEVYWRLQNSGLGLTDAEIREALDVVIYHKPDYNPANNERLIDRMTDQSPKYQEFLIKMRQCKVESEVEDSHHPRFCNLEEPHRKADMILCDMLLNMGFKEIVDVYKSIEKWYA